MNFRQDTGGWKKLNVTRTLKTCPWVRPCAKGSDQWAIQTSILLPSSTQMEMAVHDGDGLARRAWKGWLLVSWKRVRRSLPRKESYAIHVYMAYVGPPQYKNFFQGSEHYEVIHEWLWRMLVMRCCTWHQTTNAWITSPRLIRPLFTCCYLDN